MSKEGGQGGEAGGCLLARLPACLVLSDLEPNRVCTVDGVLIAAVAERVGGSRGETLNGDLKRRPGLLRFQRRTKHNAQVLLFFL